MFLMDSSRRDGTTFLPGTVYDSGIKSKKKSGDPHHTLVSCTGLKILNKRGWESMKTSQKYYMDTRQLPLHLYNFFLPFSQINVIIHWFASEKL